MSDRYVVSIELTVMVDAEIESTDFRAAGEQAQSLTNGTEWADELFLNEHVGDSSQADLGDIVAKLQSVTFHGR